MRIIYQGKAEETDAVTVAAFLAAHGGAQETVIEYNGEILAGDAAPAIPLEEGAELNVYRIVSGG